MLDFTDSAYLGLRCSADDLPPWHRFAEARPAALHEPRLAAALGRGVARLQGQEDGVIGTSSLLLALDVLGPVLSGNAWHILVDAGCYPTLTWAASQCGVPETVGHHDPVALEQSLARLCPGVRPLLAVDGFCPGCGRIAPLAVYATLLQRHGGQLLVDDTQALGLLGPGGAGSLATKGMPKLRALCVSSLAKGFGVPIAVLSGPRRLIEAFRQRSATRVHCSQPAWALVLAGMHAMVVNRRQGARLRQRLRRRVAAFRHACARLNVPLLPGAFPVQTVNIPATIGANAVDLVTALLRCGVRAFASRGWHDPSSQLRLIVNGAHSEFDVRTAAAALSAVLSGLPSLIRSREEAVL
jgi:8-amino-7-oxononanoate synthase